MVDPLTPHAMRADEAVFALAPLGMHPEWVQGPSIEIARRLALGEHPHDVCPELRPKDAREYCRLTGFEAPEPLEWLAERLPAESSPPRHIEAAYWVLARLASSRTRAAMEAALPRVDELTPAILDGAGESVRRAIELADDAAVMASWSGPEELVPPERHLDLSGLECVREVTSARDLILLGRAQRHCVGQYCAPIHRGNCRIVTVHDDSGQVVATAELKNGQVAQCYAARNSPAPPWARQLAQRAASRTK